MAGSSFSSFCPRISHQKGHSTHEKNIAIFAVILCITYLQNKYIGFYHDDYGYGSLTCAVDAHYAERTLPNIIDYLTRHYREWGGRVVFFFFELLLMQGGMSCFFLAQALVLAATLLLGKEQDSWLVLSLLLSTFLLYNEGIYRGGLFWATASVLYVWPFCPLTLGVYLLLATRQRDRLPLPVCVAVPVSFFLAAASQEQVAVVTVGLIPLLGFWLFKSAADVPPPLPALSDRQPAVRGHILRHKASFRRATRLFPASYLLTIVFTGIWTLALENCSLSLRARHFLAGILLIFALSHHGIAVIRGHYLNYPTILANDRNPRAAGRQTPPPAEVVFYRLPDKKYAECMPYDGRDYIEPWIMAYYRLPRETRIIYQDALGQGQNAARPVTAKRRCSALPAAAGRRRASTPIDIRGGDGPPATRADPAGEGDAVQNRKGGHIAPLFSARCVPCTRRCRPCDTPTHPSFRSSARRTCRHMPMRASYSCRRSRARPNSRRHGMRK